MLSLRNLSKVYGSPPRQIEAVRDVSLEVAPGRFLAVIGRSGSGKSTLLGMLGGLSRPTRGQVTINGTDLWALRENARADFRSRSVGFVFQFASLLPTLRAIDNVALPALIGKTRPAADAYARAAALLERIGLADRLDAYPGELSGGEQRRVALARALINAPPLLLADEPTADLDEETEADILDLLLDIQRDEKLTLIVVTHNLSIARRADQVVHVRQGQIVETIVPTPSAPAMDQRAATVRERCAGAGSGDPAPAQRSPPAQRSLTVAAHSNHATAVTVGLGRGLRRFLTAFAAWTAVSVLMVLGLNQGTAMVQRHRIDQKQQARRALEETAMSRLRADVEDVTAGPANSFQLTLYLWNVAGDPPIYVMAPSVRAYVQVGPMWQEVPLHSADGHDGQVLKVAGKQAYRYLFEPDVKTFEQLLPGYMHVRFSNTMLVSQRSDPGDDLVERADNYYVYLKPRDADDAAILRKMKFPGKPPLWIPMPPH
jgi:ABC-type lipoprotein export system ATPase subunit